MTEFSMNDTEAKIAEEHAKVTAYLSEDNKAAYNTILAMHTYKRPHNSGTEKRFINRFLIPLGLKKDAYGNLFKWIGKDPVVMWSSHTDTVHDRKGMLAIGFDKDEIGVSEKDKSNCLGADDGAGVWLMREMILAGKEGLYIFHRNEEHGRLGSSHIAANYQKDLKDIKFCIALDRKEKGSIVTHQQGSRCCSEAFSKSLAAQFKLANLEYKSDDGGSFTDSVSYVGLIGECTNLSVGYRNAHQHVERLDLSYIFRLRDALLKLDVSKLDEVRKPGDKEYKSYNSTTTYGGSTYYDSNRVSLFKDGSNNFYCYKDGTKYFLIKEATTPNINDEWGFGEAGYVPGEAGYVPPEHKQPDKTYSAADMSAATTKTALQVVGGTKSGTQVGTTKSAAEKFAVGEGTIEAAMDEEKEKIGTPATRYNSKLNTVGAATAASDKFTAEQLAAATAAVKAEMAKEDDEETALMSNEDFNLMVKTVERNPLVVADILEQMGYDYPALRDEILAACGVLDA